MRNKLFVLVVILISCLYAFDYSYSQQIKIGGYVQNWLYLYQENDGVLKHPGVENSTWGFRIRRARLNFKTELDNVFSVDSWFEFANDSKMLLDFKAIAKIAPEFIITVGQFSTPCQTYETSMRSSANMHFYELSDISVNLSSAMGHDSYRDVGIMFSGSTGILKYSGYIGNGNGRFIYARTNIMNRKFGQGLMGGRLDIEPFKGLMLGGHYSLNKQDSITINSTTAITNKNRDSYSFNLLTDGLGLPSLFSQFDYAAGNIKDLPFTQKYNGLSATIGYKILSQFHFVCRYDTYNIETSSQIKDEFENYTVGFTYYFMKELTELVRLGLNFEIRKEKPIDSRNNMLLAWMQIKF